MRSIRAGTGFSAFSSALLSSKNCKLAFPYTKTVIARQQSSNKGKGKAARSTVLFLLGEERYRYSAGSPVNSQSNDSGLIVVNGSMRYSSCARRPLPYQWFFKKWALPLSDRWATFLAPRPNLILFRQVGAETRWPRPQGYYCVFVTSGLPLFEAPLSQLVSIISQQAITWQGWVGAIRLLTGICFHHGPIWPAAYKPSFFTNGDNVTSTHSVVPIPQALPIITSRRRLITDSANGVHTHLPAPAGHSRPWSDTQEWHRLLSLQTLKMLFFRRNDNQRRHVDFSNQFAAGVGH